MRKKPSKINIFDTMSFKMSDKGARDTFKSGAQREPKNGSGRFDLLSPFALLRLARVAEKGATKYTPRNWEAGMPFSECLNRVLIHINDYRMGKRDEDHLAHAMWGLHAILHYEAMHPEMNDIPKYLTEDGKP